jgi:hypothetical protein
VDGGLRFDWDIDNVGHLARRHVRPEEAEQILRGPVVDLDYRVTAEG